MDIEAITAPTDSEVLALLSVAEFKRNERIFDAHTDDLIEACIKGAYAFLDGQYGWLNRSILTREWKLWLPCLPTSIELPLGPILSVESIKYFDTDGVLQTLDASTYEVLTGEFIGRICMLPYETLPAGISKRNRAVSISYTAGFGDAETIDFSIKHALKQSMTLLASHFYRNPSATFADPRQSKVSRQIQYGIDEFVGFLRIPSDLR